MEQDTINLPGFEPVAVQPLAGLLSEILEAVNAVNDADNLLQAIASTRDYSKQTTNRNAIMKHQVMEMASGGLDCACRDLAEKCRTLSFLLRKK